MVTAKISRGDDLRRFQILDTDKWGDVDARIRLLYNIPAAENLNVKYEDSDGDQVCIGSDLELEEATREARDSGVLRFTLAAARTTASLAEGTPVSDIASTAAANATELSPSIATRLVVPAGSANATESVYTEADNTEPVTIERPQPTLSENSSPEPTSANLNAAQLPPGEEKEEEDTSSNDRRQQQEENSYDPDAKYVHWGVTCDMCGSVIVGARFKCALCPDYDLCEECEANPTAEHKARHSVWIKFNRPMRAQCHAYFDDAGFPGRFFTASRGGRGRPGDHHHHHDSRRGHAVRHGCGQRPCV